MPDVAAELKSLRLLYGIVGACRSSLLRARPRRFGPRAGPIEHLLQSEHTEKAMRSIS